MATQTLCFLLLLPSATATLGSCAADFVPQSDLRPDRAACTAGCATAGYCCGCGGGTAFDQETCDIFGGGDTNNYGGCNALTCSMGCLIAWHSSTQAECVAECTLATAAAASVCQYTHAASGTELQTCGQAQQCGCPAEGSVGYDANNLWGTANDGAGDCEAATACAAGCAIAANVSAHSFYGRPLTSQEVQDNAATVATSEQTVSGLLDDFAAHVAGTAILTTAQMASKLNTFKRNKRSLKRSSVLFVKANDLIDAYGSRLPFPFPSTNVNEETGQIVVDGHEFDRLVLEVVQAVLDEFYNAGDRGRTSVLAECSRSTFEGRAWPFASIYPGAAAPPADPTVTHAVHVYATVAATWGARVNYWHDAVRRPTGLWLSAGQVGSVTVPSTLVNAGFSILVGGQTADHVDKGQRFRPSRASVTVPITSTTTLIANPLGGGVYILVPYLATAGTVTIQVSGGVVRAPLFQRTSQRTMTNADWLAVRGNPGPWADFETDKFMLNVPSSWVYNFDDPTSLLEIYDKAMDGTAEWLGYPIGRRQRTAVWPNPRRCCLADEPQFVCAAVRHLLFLQPDVQISGTAFTPGYPQINQEYEMTQTYDGNHNHWLVRRPVEWSTCWHELGHAQQSQDSTFQYWSETEAIVNFLHVYILRTPTEIQTVTVAISL
jgi:hypothetical protein